MDSKPARGRRKIYLFGGALALALAAVGTIAYTATIRADHRRIQDKIRDELMALRSAKDPLAAGDFAKLYPDPAPQLDAARLLGPVLAQMHVPREVDQLPIWSAKRFPPAGAPLDSNTRVEVEHILASNGPALLMAEQIELKGTWYVTGFSGGFSNVSNPRLRQLVDLARLLCLDAAVKAERQDGPGAARSLCQALQLSKTCRSPVPIRQMSAWVMEGSGTEALERVLNCTALSGSELDLLVSATDTVDEDGIRRILLGERGLEFSIFERFGDVATQLVNSAGSPVTHIWSERIAERVVSERDLLGFLEWQKQLFAMLQFSTRQQLEWIATNKPPRPEKHKRASLAMLTTMTDPSHYFEGHASALTKLRLARTALAIERYRLAHNGNRPDNLTALTPVYLATVPTDPFSNQPLRYQELSSGYRIYSVGPDFTDDGGKDRPDNATNDVRWDVTITIRR